MSQEKKIAVFGAKGMLGQDLCRVAPPTVSILSYDIETDFTDIAKVEAALDRDKPDWVVNAAGYTNVDGAEKDFKTAVALNVRGPENLAKVCDGRGIPLIHVSTDFVFDGLKSTPYEETEEPTPRGVYAQTKREGEIKVSKIKDHYVLRTSSLYGKARMNHAERVLVAVKEGQRVKAVTDMICSPTYTGDLAKWIYDLIAKRPLPGIYHLVHTGSCSRSAFAEEICRAMGAGEPYPIDSIKLSDLNLAAPRPPRAVLNTGKWEKAVGQLFSWEEGLQHYFAEMKIKRPETQTRSGPFV